MRSLRRLVLSALSISCSLVGLALHATPTCSAPARTLGPPSTGINLSWDDCGTAGQASRNFACDLNTGSPFTMIGSFVPPAGINYFLGISADLTVQSSTASLPDWWKFGTVQCRGTTGLVTNFLQRQMV